MLRIVLFLTLLVSVNIYALPTQEEMWQIIQKQQKMIEKLNSKVVELEATKREEKVAESKEKVADHHDSWKKDPWWEKTSISGYGELHYNNLSDNNTNIGGDDNLDRVDFHRFTLGFEHEFNDRIKLDTELEVEHTDEVSLEEAKIEIALNDQHEISAGLDILPIGIINWRHEPNTYYGVERHYAEFEIIPGAWREAFISLSGEVLPSWHYNLILHSGLVTDSEQKMEDTVNGDETALLRPRAGRMSAANAEDQDLAFTTVIRYTPQPNLEIGWAGHYQADMTGTADAFEVPATLFSAHIDYKHNSGLALRALYARWDMDLPNGIAINQDSLIGWYIEPAYRFKLPSENMGDLGLFFRFSHWDQQENNVATDDLYARVNGINTGFNWWPHPAIVLKFDYQNQWSDDPIDELLDGFNLGLGYVF